VPPCRCWGRLPTSLGEAKFSRFVVGSIQVGDATQLLNGVPKNVAEFVLGQALHAAFRLDARAPLASSLGNLGFDAPSLPP
jgi:hypothetical protein